MSKFLRLLFLALALPIISVGQQPWENNDKLDNIQELCTSYTVPFVMPDGVTLYTDVYLPILRDNMEVEFDIAGQNINIQLLRKGTQLLVYDSINGQPNPNPYQLPMIFSRTPYDKGNGDNAEGPAITTLGYVYAVQDMRGRYTSEGVYLPLLSDSWDKNAYHANWQHVLDRTLPSDPKNGNKHEDGYNSIKFITDSLMRDYDFDGDGIIDTTDLMVNGRIGMLGASALGYNQYQAAAAHRIDPTQPGLKCLLPIVAPGDFYKSTGFGNGVLRDRLVTGWLKGQIFTGTEDERIPEDEAIAVQTDTLTATQNDIHSSFDYDLPKKITFNGVEREYQQNKFDAANLAIDHFVSMRYPDENGNLGPCGYYPNSVGRTEMDISRARVDANGEGLAGGQYNRYSNMEVPAYHVTGWWDIFIDGQIETWANMKRFLDPAKGNNRKQKIVIGPWAHQTIGEKVTGDREYPANIGDLLGINFEDFEGDELPITTILTSEVIAWFRYNLNYQPDQYLGEPKAVIPEGTEWQTFSLPLLGQVQIRVPAYDYKMPFNSLLAFLNGSGGLNGMPIDIITSTGRDTTFYDIPPTGNPAVDGWQPGEVSSIQLRDFEDQHDVADVRFYVIGPNNDSLNPDNLTLGNYWFAADTFPLGSPYVEHENWYMHKNGTLNQSPPVTDEGYNIYIHDPDDPVRCVGGANMIVRTPDGERNSQGQFNIKDPRYAEYTVDRPGVVQYTSDAIEQDSMCIIGFPVANIYAKTNPGGVLTGPTDTDFFVRIIDVYPDGREYFITEGCVNARAKDYAKALVDHPEWDQNYPYIIDDIPFTNIEIGKIEEYRFQMLPIAYTFGKGHKIKILISSSLYTRWQVNPNLPINDGEFFRRKPGDGRKYIFNGVEMSPRVATQRIAFAPEYQTHIKLPVYKGGYVLGEETKAPSPQVSVYPNPVQDELNIALTEVGKYTVSIYDIRGGLISSEQKQGNLLSLNVSSLAAGSYIVEVLDEKAGTKSAQKFTKK